MNFVISFKVFCFTALLCLLTSREAYAQDEPINTPEQCMQIIVKGLGYSEKGQHVKSLELLIKAEANAKKNNWKKEFFWATNGLGLSYRRLSNMGEASSYYLRALKLANELESDEYIATVYNNIGDMWLEEDNTKALEYFNKAYPHTNPKEFNSTRLPLALNIADIYNSRGNYKEAQHYLKEVENIAADPFWKQLWKVYYAESLILEGKSQEAKNILDTLLNNEKPTDNILTSSIYSLLSKIYLARNNFNLAIVYALKSLETTQDMRFKIQLYNQLSELYFKSRDYGKSKQYKDSVITAKDSLTKLINSGLFESNKVKFKVQQYQNELQLNQEKRSAERKIFIGGIIASFLLSFSIYKALKSKIVKQKQEKLLADNRQKIIDLELEGLKNNIAEKNRKLSAKALYLSSRNELIEEVINSLSQIPEVSASKQVSDYMRTLKGYLKTDAEWDDFISYFEQVNPEFIRKLTIRYPDLTPADIRFICYVYMNLDTKEIGNIFNITYNAAKKRKARIKEKMNIDNEASLYDHLLQIA
jgi:DNA-binding CsgD family transcriptional regulator